MDNRTRKNQLKIYLTDEEKEIFEKKMRLANCKTMSHFLRKCVLEKEINDVDLELFRDFQCLLSNVTNNINQIAKATNTTGVIYKKDIDYMREKIEKIIKESGALSYYLSGAGSTIMLVLDKYDNESEKNKRKPKKIIR